MRPYILKRKDDDIALVNITEEGTITDYRLIEENSRLAPLHEQGNTDWLKLWWKRRAVPIAQGQIKAMLEKRGFFGSEDYLIKNLGLSLTDYYWLSPVGQKLTWQDVSLFTNEFHDDINIAGDEEDASDIPCYTPNCSLQGSLEKCWTIRNGKRGMIKGNRGNLSAESFNEVIASKLHELQGFDNYTPYKLIEIHGKEYAYGCFSELFTSERLELISAYEVVTSRKQRQDVSSYEHFIKVCESYGLREDVLRPFLEYEIMTDFILSGCDRHLSNISVLRDADTLEFVKPAPIYDSGNAMFVSDIVPTSEKDMLRIRTESFYNKELKLLDLVRDKSLVDIDKLPSLSFIKDIYGLDPNIDESRIDSIARGYEMKISLFSRWQKGENLKKITVGASYKKRSKAGLGDIFA